jgi:hypothetical protein
MPRVLSHGMQYGVYAQCQTGAKFSNDSNFLIGFLGIAILPQGDSFVERNA